MSTIQKFLQSLRIDPQLLKQEYPEMIKFLHIMTDKKGQGSGNKPTSQEACFAVEAQKLGFKFEEVNTNGCFIKYQPYGTQRSIDFILTELLDGTIKSIKIDLKHTNTKTFYWNDGWFENDVIYVVSYTQKKQNKIYIGYGEDTPTEQDKLDMAEIVEFKKKWNSENKNTGFLRKYLRFANQYSCDQFTDEFSREKFESIERRLT
jgi:hypothetical protein